ncbi:MAG: 6-phosphofructokinase [Deltaproteobacteria bacterium]|nr:6-phosphofructokinase [Deltaproteobacteria bacterium]
MGILTAGGDCPGLNAAIRAVVKTAKNYYGMEVVGILDGFRGLVENRVVHFSEREMSGLLTIGGTILGTSRDKPHKMPMSDGTTKDLTGAAVETYRRLNLDGLVCIGGGGTSKNALRLAEAGLNVITLPKTIDNDVAETDVTFGFESAMAIATEAIDRLHTTASSHARIMLVDIMGHNAGWLALGASIAGGADVCLIPEYPYQFPAIVEALEGRKAQGKRFSLIAVAEGARPHVGALPPGSGLVDSKGRKPAKEGKEKDRDRDKDRDKDRDRERERDDVKDPKDSRDSKDAKESKEAREAREAKEAKDGSRHSHKGSEVANSTRLAADLERTMGVETRVTTLGHVQRGGVPSPGDRLLATQLGIAAVRAAVDGVFGVMIAVKSGQMVRVPLEKVAGRKKTVPDDHPWVVTARHIGLCLGI